jgi:hypothetical protein
MLYGLQKGPKNSGDEKIQLFLPEIKSGIPENTKRIFLVSVLS